MSKRLLMVTWLMVMLVTPALQGWTSPAAMHGEFFIELDGAEPAQSSGYSGVIPMDLSVMVGDSGNDLTNAFNFLAAVPFAIRSNSTHTASGLILPDDIESYASPLDDWIEFLGGSLNELVFLGDVYNPDHMALDLIADSYTQISGTDYATMAANLAEEFFVGSSSVVLVEAPIVSQFSDTTIITSTTATLSPMSSRTQTGRTSSSTDWEYFGSFDPSGGGAIITLTSGDEYIWFDLLAREGTNYYPLDFPYYDGVTVMYPFEERPGSTWILHAIDLYDYDRSVTLNFNIDVPDADFYPFTVAPGEDCRIDFDLTVSGGVPRDIGINVLGPSGDIVLTSNRFTLFEDVDETNEISVSLSHPGPGNYRAYVYSAEHTSVSYDLSIVKKVISSDYVAATAGAANGAALASLLGAPLLYTHGGSLSTATEQAIETIAPQSVFYVNPTGPVDAAVEDELEELGLFVTAIENFTQMQNMLSALDVRSSNQGSVVLYDSIGTNFAAAGLSAAQRKSAVIPYSYEDSNLMTLSQIPEQISWHREYQMPLIATFTLLDIWTDDARLSEMNPPVETMTDISDRFFPWLSTMVGIDTVDDVITIAPYYGPGEALPPSFERALTGKADAGRYSSIDTDATLVQLMRSILRIPLMSLSSRSHEALGSYLVYSYDDSVMANNHVYNSIDNSDDFGPMVASSGLSPVMQVGPSTISELGTAPYTWVATVHGGIGYDLYEHDGRVALFNSDVWRAYDSGGSPSFPDVDSTESPQYIVNPPESYMTIYNMSQLVSGTNLRGMFALLDSCQVGSSYGPSTMMESGADAVVACRTDTLVGPADMLEYNILRFMIDYEETLGEALDSAFDSNSHRYALSDIGVDTYTTSSDVAVVGASCLQFSIFGDPDITMFDWSLTPYPIMERCVAIGPMSAASAHPGSTYQLPLGMHDPVGNMYASEGTYSISVFDAEDNPLTSGVAICTNYELGVFDIAFSSSSALGVYDIEITDMSTNDTFTSHVILEWPLLVIQSIESSSYSELGTWSIDIVLYNPQDVVAETTIQVSLNNDIILISEASWLPGFSSNNFEIIMMFGPSGSQTLNVLIIIGTQAIQCCDYDTLVHISGHWVTPVLWLVIPALSVCVVLSGVYTRRIGGKMILIRTGMEAEIAGEHETAFDIYGKNGLSRAATRVAVKEDLPEEMMQALMHYYGNVVFNDLQAIANTARSNRDFRRASKIHIVLGHNEQGLQFKAMAELEEGQIDDAVQTFHEMLSIGVPKYAVNVLDHIQSLNEDIQSKFVTQAKDDILTIASRLRYEAQDQKVLMSVVEGRVEDEYLLGLLVSFDKIDEAAEKILSLKTIPKMVKLTKTLDENQRNSVAIPIFRSLTQTHKPKQAAKYITSIDISDSVAVAVVSPLIEQLINEPSNKEILAALQSISKSSSAGSIRVIDEAIEAVKAVITSAEELGVSTEHLKSSSLIPVIAGLKDRAMAEKLLAQTEKQALNNSVPASANIDALAKYVYGLRTSVYSYDDVLPQIPLKLANYEGTLQNRIGQTIQEAFTMCRLRIDTDDWLEVSSDEIVEKIVTSIPLVDSISAVKGCFRAVNWVTSQHISAYLESSFGVEKQAELANKLMEDPLMRDRILRRHMKATVDEHGRTKWVPDYDAAQRDAFDHAVAQWKPQATSVFKIGIFKAALKITQQAFDSQIPSKELFDIAVIFLFGAHSFSSLEHERILGFIRLLPRYFDRGEMEVIIRKTRFPITILDEALS